MQTIDRLMEEHREIERVIDALLEWAAACGDGDANAEADAGDFATWFSEFADAHHHGKEEQLLFVAMVEAGMPRNGGPIAVMLREHDIGRDQVAILRDAAGHAMPWPNALRADVADAADRFADLLRPHIMKEDQILYRMAEQVLSPEQKTALDAACAAFEVAFAARHEAMTTLGAALLERWSPA